MKFDILTLFPDMFVGPLTESIIKRAVQAGHIEITLHNIRDWATDRHKTVDDSPYGGGAGMLMKPAPLAAAIRAVRGQEVRGQGSGVRGQEPEAVEPRPNNNPATSPAPQRQEMQQQQPGHAIPAPKPHPLAPSTHVIYLSPDGQPFTQQVAEELAQFERLILVCGRYEGIDERVRETLIDRELSVGDFVLTGGELGAMIVLDVVARLVPGVLDEASPIEETFGDGLLEYPQYTRPLDWEGQQVPAVLLSGHHAEVATWRRRQRLERTLRKRPDLLTHARLTPADQAYLAGLGWEGDQVTG